MAIKLELSRQVRSKRKEPDDPVIIALREYNQSIVRQNIWCRRIAYLLSAILILLMIIASH